MGTPKQVRLQKAYKAKTVHTPGHSGPTDHVATAASNPSEGEYSSGVVQQLIMKTDWTWWGKRWTSGDTRKQRNCKS